MRYMSLALGLLLLSACASGPALPRPEPEIRTVEVKVPTPVPCAALGKLGPEPSYADTDAALAATPDIFEASRILLKGRLQRLQRLVEYGAAKTACIF